MGGASRQTSCRSPSPGTPPARSHRSMISSPWPRSAFGVRRCRSIGSVARLRVVSRPAAAEHASEINADGAVVAPVKPAAHPPGTTIEVRELFFNVPARPQVHAQRGDRGGAHRAARRAARASRFDVAFKSARAGAGCCSMHPRRSGWARCWIYPAARRTHEPRACSSEEFLASAVPIHHSAGPVSITGWVGLPTVSRATADQQYWFVNGRGVRDRLLVSAVRVGYRDVLYGGRHPAYVLYLIARSDAGGRECASGEAGGAVLG